jgi:hypothetical protein
VESLTGVGVADRAAPNSNAVRGEVRDEFGGKIKCTVSAFFIDTRGELYALERTVDAASTPHTTTALQTQMSVS